jgi:hypothetical protein
MALRTALYHGRACACAEASVSAFRRLATQRLAKQLGAAGIHRICIPSPVCSNMHADTARMSTSARALAHAEAAHALLQL